MTIINPSGWPLRTRPAIQRLKFPVAAAISARRHLELDDFKFARHAKNQHKVLVRTVAPAGRPDKLKHLAQRTQPFRHSRPNVVQDAVNVVQLANCPGGGFLRVKAVNADNTVNIDEQKGLLSWFGHDYERNPVAVAYRQQSVQICPASPISAIKYRALAFDTGSTQEQQARVGGLLRGVFKSE